MRCDWLFERYPQCILAASSSRPVIPTGRWHRTCTCLRKKGKAPAVGTRARASSRGRLRTGGGWKCAAVVWSLVTWDRLSPNITRSVCVCVCACVCVCTCACACVRVHVRVRVRACALLTRAFQLVVAGTTLILNLSAIQSAQLIGFEAEDILANVWEVTGQNCRGKHNTSAMKRMYRDHCHR